MQLDPASFGEVQVVRMVGEVVRLDPYVDAGEPAAVSPAQENRQLFYGHVFGQMNERITEGSARRAISR